MNILVSLIKFIPYKIFGLCVFSYGVGSIMSAYTDISRWRAKAAMRLGLTFIFKNGSTAENELKKFNRRYQGGVGFFFVVGGAIYAVLISFAIFALVFGLMGLIRINLLN